MHGDQLRAVATARHAERVAAAHRAAHLTGYPAPSGGGRLWLQRWHQRADVASACHGHGSDANSLVAASVSPLERRRMALE